jgi:hypothetical protein
MKTKNAFVGILAETFPIKTPPAPVAMSTRTPEGSPLYLVEPQAAARMLGLTLEEAEAVAIAKRARMAKAGRSRSAAKTAAARENWKSAMPGVRSRMAFRCPVELAEAGSLAAKKQGLNFADYLRRLVERDMAKTEGRQ